MPPTNTATQEEPSPESSHEMVAENQALVVVPTFNEADNIARLLSDLARLYPLSVDILVIDDNSPDGTADIVRSMIATTRGLHLMTRHRKLGLGTAYLAGFRYALERGYRYIIEMDADYSHDPAVVGRFLKAMERSDLVIGSRYVNNTVNVVNWPLGRLILSKLACIYTRFITGLPVADPTSGFKCFRAKVLQELDLDSINSQGYSFQIEMNFRAWKKGFSIQELPIIFVDRTVGKSKMTQKNIREAVRIVWWLKIKSIFGFL